MEIALDKKMNKIKDFPPIIKHNLPRSCYVYNSTGYTAITTKLYPYKTNSCELYTMVYLEIISATHRSFPRTFSSQRSPKSSSLKSQICMHGQKITEHASFMLKSLVNVAMNTPT